MAETGKPDQLTLSATRCVSLEWEKLWHPYLAPLDDALATTLAWYADRALLPAR